MSLSHAHSVSVSVCLSQSYFCTHTQTHTRTHSRVMLSLVWGCLLKQGDKLCLLRKGHGQQIKTGELGNPISEHR